MPYRSAVRPSWPDAATAASRSVDASSNAPAWRAQTAGHEHDICEVGCGAQVGKRRAVVADDQRSRAVDEGLLIGRSHQPTEEGERQLLPGPPRPADRRGRGRRFGDRASTSVPCPTVDRRPVKPGPGQPDRGALPT